jgi:hypothetical protein
MFFLLQLDFCYQVKYNYNHDVKKDYMGGTCSTNGEKRDVCSLLVENPEGKGPLGRTRRRWMENIKIDLGETGWGSVDWT